MPKKKTTEQFIADAIAVHGVDRYDYSLVEYVGCMDRVKIICLIHGEFEQTPAGHLDGACGCTPCTFDGQLTRVKIERKKYKKSFLKRCILVHDGFYRYDRVDYVNTLTPVEIFCPIHGYFFQTPERHLQGGECQSCNRSSDNDLIYIFRAENLYCGGVQVYKVGVSSQRLPSTQRHRQIERLLGSPVTSIAYIPIDTSMFMATEIETGAHDELGDPVKLYYQNGTERTFSGSGEFRAIPDDDLARLIFTLEQFRMKEVA